MGWKWMPMVVALGLAAACGNEAQPADDGIIDDETDGEETGDDEDDQDDVDDDDEPEPGDDDDDDAPEPEPGDDDDDDDDDDDAPPDPPPAGTCRPAAERMIVLGDSIVACQGVGGKDSADCAPKRFHTHYDSTYQTLPYENLAVSGARTADVVNQQLNTVSTGIEGHALVVIYVGGNDLSPNLLLPDAAAESNFAQLSTELESHWETIFAFFEDPANFPDGATLLINTQYDPFDGCTSQPWNVSQLKLGLLVEYNDAMTARGDARDWVFVADQHSPFLGHGHHNGAPDCPYYAEGMEGWMNDFIHPNAAGHTNLADVMAGVAATMYEGC